MVFKKGEIPWNKGLSADPDNPNYDQRVAKYVNVHIGKPSGALGKTWKWSDESRLKQSEIMSNKVPWNKGLTKETDPRVAKSADTLSKRITSDPQLLETLRKNGKANKGREPWNKNLTKETDPRVTKYANSLTGIIRTPDFCEKVRKAKLFQSPEDRTRIGRIGGLASMAKLTPVERSARALKAFLAVPKTNTSIELKLQKHLDNWGIQYTTQVPLLGITAIDIFVKPNVCVYANGNYWHNYPNGTESDDKITQTLENSGYKVFRFWGSEIRENPDQCIMKILEYIKK